MPRLSDSLVTATVFLAVALASQRRFDTALLAGRHIEGMSFDFFDDVFLLHLALKATQSALERFAIAQSHFGHAMVTSLNAQTAKLRMQPIAKSGVAHLSGERGKSETKKWKIPGEGALQFHCYAVRLPDPKSALPLC